MGWSDGRGYEGEFEDGRKHGDGSLKWPDGRSYSGQWCAGKQHGRALACTSRGLKKDSLWKNGKFVEWVGKAIEEETSTSPSRSPGSPAVCSPDTNSPNSMPAFPTSAADVEPPSFESRRERRHM